MIGAYAQHGHGKEALQLFGKMQQGGTKPNSITFISILDTCATLSTLREGKLVHAYVVEMGLALDLGTALVNMYGKCGNLEEAYMMFLSFCDKDGVSWNVMLAAYAHMDTASGLFNSIAPWRRMFYSQTLSHLLVLSMHVAMLV